ncbi:MAG: DUF4249 family protein [Gemmatimonadaceae bacterium]|nr:DUF4249 family protein [Gemmatimonadaceae bacterium]
MRGNPKTPRRACAPTAGAVLVGAIACGAIACGDPTATAASAREPVVRAYLYAGQPVNDIRLTWTAPIGTPDSLADSASPPINDAAVTLVRSGVRYLLTRSPGDSGYYRYTGTDLTVREGDVFDLDATVNGKSLTARTTVPVRPSGAHMSAPTLKVPTFTFTPGSGPPDFTAGTVLVRWTKSSAALYFVTLESAEASPVRIDLNVPIPIGGGRRFIFPPTSADSTRVNVFSLTYYGKYTARVWRVNEEYAQLYATLQQDSRDLNEPISNVYGGLGIFSAFSADTTSFTVVK